MTPEQHKERREREAIFLREHRAQHAVWGSEIPLWSKDNPAGPGPTQSNDTPDADSGDGKKA